MLTCEGYKMFEGSALIVPKCAVPPFRMSGTWLYKPDTGCWYINGKSFMAEIVTDFKED